MANVVIYGDGACSGNPGPGGWAFLLVDAPRSRVIEKSGHAPHTTNNRMELTALIESLEELLVDFPKETSVEFFWDSAYVVNGFNEWLFGWARRDFHKADGTEISNPDLWRRVWDLKRKLPPLKMTQIPGHSGLPGNERVDELSVAQSKSLASDPYIGSLTDYRIPFAELLAPKSMTSDPNKKYPTYLALLDGRLSRFGTWDECKAFVNGTAAKYKKVKNTFEESQTLKLWKF
ncbi:MAG TPA: ribonuclease H [Bdellovibrionota bacterium]|nr:ribonuclease H [Bdellovibrionota bacterium]